MLMVVSFCWNDSILVSRFLYVIIRGLGLDGIIIVMVWLVLLMVDWRVDIVFFVL